MTSHALHEAAAAGDVLQVNQILNQVCCLYDFEARPDTTELSIKEGEILTIACKDVGNGWWEGTNTASQSGLFPASYVEPMIDVNLKNEKGDNALIIAANKGDIDTVKALVEHGAIDVNAFNKTGRTALMCACWKGIVAMADILLKAGADWQLKNHKGQTAMDLAAFKKHRGIGAIIKSYSSKPLQTCDSDDDIYENDFSSDDEIYVNDQVQLRNTKLKSNVSSLNMPKSQSSNSIQATDLNDKINFYDTFYETIGLDTKIQENSYRKMAHVQRFIKAISVSRPKSNAITYFLNNEHEYIETVNKIADGKKLFPVEIQPFLGPVEKLPEFHKDLHKALNVSQNSITKMAEVFIHRKEHFRIYEIILLNSVNFEKQLSILGGYKKTGIKDMYEPLRQTRKRLHFYFQCLEELLSESSDKDGIKIKEAVDILKNYYRSADTGLLIKNIKRSPIQLEFHKPLHLHSLVYMSGPHIHSKEYRVLLFEEIIVVALANKVEHEFQLNINMEVTQLEDSDDPKKIILHVDLGGVIKMKKYIFRFKDENIKQEWKKEILEIKKRYVEKIKRMSTHL